MKAITCSGVVEVPFQLGLVLLRALLEFVLVPCKLLSDLLTLFVDRILLPLQRGCNALIRRMEAFNGYSSSSRF